MKSYPLIIFIFFANFIFSCSYSNKSTKIVNTYTFSIRTVEKNIPTRDELRHFYRFHQTKNDSLFLYNAIKYGMNIVNLESDEVSFIPFEFDGPNHTDPARTFYFHNRDSIFISEELSIAILNIQGELVHRVHLNLGDDIFEDKANLYDTAPSDSFSHQLIYNPDRKTLYLYFQNFDQNRKKRIIGELDLVTGKIKSIPIYYSDHYKSTKFHGYLFSTAASLTETGIIYVFSGDPTVFKYDFNSKNVTSKIIKPYDGNEFAAELPQGPIGEIQYKNFVKNNPFYAKILYDPYRQIYYRLSIPPQPHLSDDKANLIENNKIHISVLDMNLNLIRNITLEKQNKYHFGFVFVFSEGLWLAYNELNQDDEDLIKGDVVVVDIDYK